MTEDNTQVQTKNSYYCIYWFYILNTYERETKLFELPRDTNKEKL